MQGGGATIRLKLAQASHTRSTARKGTASMSTVQPQPGPVLDATHERLDVDVLMTTKAPVTAARRSSGR